MGLELTYAGMILLGLSLFVLFRPTAQYSNPDRRKYLQIQLITLLAALLGAKFAVLMGDALWPLRPFHDWPGLIVSGRSIVGALLFGFIAAEVAKPLLNYPLAPNDRFAMILPFSIATGRLGCWMSGCCLGIEMDGPLALTGVDGISRFPAPLAELVFHLIAGTVLIVLWRNKIWVGRLFAAYLVAYGVFRFGSEYWRVTAKAFFGFSAYQLFSVAMVFAGGIALYLRRDFPAQQSNVQTEAP